MFQIQQPRKQFLHHKLSNKRFEIKFTKTTITLYTKNYIATVKTDGNTVKELTQDIKNAPTAALVMQWFHFILHKKKSATLSVEERPTWCASRYKSVGEYRKIIEVVKDERTGFKIPTSPHQTKKYKYFLTWEEWITSKGTSLDYYGKK